MAHRKKYDGPVFCHTFELDVTPHEARLLRIRLATATQFYNAMLGEAHRRLKACRQDPRWQEALGLLKSDVHGSKTQARALFDACRKAHGYSEFGLMDCVKDWRCNVLREHLDAKACQELAKRAFRACEAFRKDRTHRNGKRRRIAFARRRDFQTVSSIGMKVDPVARTVTWWGLCLPYTLSEKDTDGLEAYVLVIMADPARICEYGTRITRKRIRGQDRYFLQVTLQGETFRKTKHPLGKGDVGLDLGPSAIAIVTPNGEGLASEKRPLAPGCAKDEKKLRRLQRYLDRSRRAMNPECFDAQGRCIAKPRIKSKRYLRAEARMIETERRLAAKRVNGQHTLIHEILAKGDTIKTEALSYKGWQRGLFGKSIGRSAPGKFIADLRTKTERFGGQFIEVPTRDTRCSQLCHGCGTYVKKALSLRVHQCACGVGPLDRDIYSAFLVRTFSLADKSLDVGVARATFAVLLHGATDVQGATQITSLGQLAASVLDGASAQRSDSGADRALSQAEASVDGYAEERSGDTPTLRGKTRTRRKTLTSWATHGQLSLFPRIPGGDDS
jgi:transposase